MQLVIVNCIFFILALYVTKRYIQYPNVTEKGNTTSINENLDVYENLDVNDRNEKILFSFILTE